MNMNMKKGAKSKEGYKPWIECNGWVVPGWKGRDRKVGNHGYRMGGRGGGEVRGERR